MAKRPDNLQTVRLALELLKRIPMLAKISAEDLRQQLADAGIKRDLRTIQRQLKMLTEHFDVECDDTDKPYGYRLKEKARSLALPRIGPRESLLLLLAAQQLKPLLPASLFKSMEPFFKQASRNLDFTSSAQHERDWLKKVRVVSTSQPLVPPKIKTGIFEEVSNALYGNFWLAVDYQNADGDRTKADIMPLGLAQQGPRLYLACRFKGYDNERSLALHRIISARQTTLTFERPKNFNLDAYEADGRFAFGGGKRICLSFKITKPAGLHLLESPLSADQTAEELDEEYLIRATVVESMLLETWIKGFGGKIRAISRMPVPQSTAEANRSYND